MTDFILTCNRMTTAVVLTASTERAKEKLKDYEFQGYQPYIDQGSVLFEPRYINCMVGDLLDQGYTVDTTTGR